MGVWGETGCSVGVFMPESACFCAHYNGKMACKVYRVGKFAGKGHDGVDA